MTPGTIGRRALVEQTHRPIQSEASAGAVSAPGWHPVFSSAAATFVSRVFFKLTFATLHGETREPGTTASQRHRSLIGPGLHLQVIG